MVAEFHGPSCILDMSERKEKQTEGTDSFHELVVSHEVVDVFFSST